MAISARDRKIRLFNVLSGKITQVIDDSLDVYSTIQQVLFFIKYSKYFQFYKKTNLNNLEYSSISQYGIW
jgi:hypothetical protein